MTGSWISFKVREEDYGFQEKEMIFLGETFHPAPDTGKNDSGVEESL